MDSHRIISALFGAPRALVGVIHTGPLPGTPRGGRSMSELVDAAAADARIYASAGFHAVMIENTHDRPYVRRSVGPEIVAAMTAIGRAVRQAVDLPLGVQVLAGANEAALAVALSCGAAFVRVEGFVFGHVADEGFIDASAGPLLRYRRAIGADHVRVFADVKKKHSAHAITADVDIVETARAAEFFLVDGVIVTGVATGQPADAAEVRAVAEAVSVPTLVGSGVTLDNLHAYDDADGLIVGSWIKKGGLWSEPIDEDRARRLADAFAGIMRTV